MDHARARDVAWKGAGRPRLDRDTYTRARSLGETSSPTLHTLAVRIMLVIAPCIAIIALVRRRIVGIL